MTIHRNSLEAYAKGSQPIQSGTARHRAKEFYQSLCDEAAPRCACLYLYELENEEGASSRLALCLGPSSIKRLSCKEYHDCTYRA